MCYLNHFIVRGTCRKQNPDIYIFQEWEEHKVMYINRRRKPKDDREIISTKDEIIYTSTLLQYIVEGIVPLFSTFCAEFQECVDEDELSVKPLEENHKTILNDLGSAVAVSIYYNWFLMQMICSTLFCTIIINSLH